MRTKTRGTANGRVRRRQQVAKEGSEKEDQVKAQRGKNKKIVHPEIPQKTVLMTREKRGTPLGGKEGGLGHCNHVELKKKQKLQPWKVYQDEVA